MGRLPGSLPVFLIPDIPLNFHTLLIILPYAAGLAVVGLLESMMTATIVDDMTDTGSDKNRECKAQGIANICTAFIGGMAGCAMIGQSVINVKSGGRGRLSTLTAGVVLLLMVVFLRQWVSQIPMAAPGRRDDYGICRNLLLAVDCQPAHPSHVHQRGDAGHRRRCGRHSQPGAGCADRRTDCLAELCH